VGGLALRSELQQAGAAWCWCEEGRSGLPSLSVRLSVRPSAGTPVMVLARSWSSAGACPWSVSVRALCLQMYIFKRDLNRLLLEAGQGGVRRGLALPAAGPSFLPVY